MPLPLVPFLYLRHGETDWNAAGRAQGRSDIPLNTRGRGQAEDAAASLATVRVDAIVASPLRRAHETASLVGARLGLSVATAPLGQEVSFGDHEGEPMGAWYEQWLAGDLMLAGSESFAALRTRAAEAMAPHLEPGRATVFVAHGALFRAVRAVLGLPIDHRLANGVPLQCTPEASGWQITPVILQQRIVQSD